MRVPRFISSMLSSAQTTDVEKGSRQSGRYFENGGGTRDATSQHVPPVVDRDPQIQAALNEFRLYVGIHNDPDLVTGRPIPNVGIYHRLVKYERQYKSQYQTFQWLINSALGLQIIFAAALTALGAGNGPRSAITAFGAMNTIIAGFLTYLKGSGLPNRFKYYKEEVTKVREYVEQREREISRGDVHVDVATEFRAIEEMYENLKRDIEINTPEAFVSRTKEAGFHSGSQIDRFSAKARSQLGDYEEKFNNTRSGLQSRLSEARLGADNRYRDTKSGIDDRVNSVRYGIESHLSQERSAMENRLSDARQGIDSQYQQARTGVDRQISNARVASAAQVENTRTEIESRLEDTRSGLTSQVEETRQGMEERLKEVQTQVKEQEEKIMGIAEKVAEKVLAVTQSRHGHDPR